MQIGPYLATSSDGGSGVWSLRISSRLGGLVARRCDTRENLPLGKSSPSRPFLLIIRTGRVVSPIGWTSAGY